MEKRTMSFGPIIQAAGIDPKNYSRAPFFRVNLFDSKDINVSDENVKYVKPLFEENPEALEKFLNLLQRMEEIVPSFIIDVKIDEHAVIVFHHTPKAEIFLRKSQLNPLDYAD